VAACQPVFEDLNLNPIAIRVPDAKEEIQSLIMQTETILRQKKT
jgi:hypothetical protein